MQGYDKMRDLLSDKPVAFRPQLARLLGRINAALFFQQIAFWSNTKLDSESGYGAWIYKTQAELESETAMTRYEQESARKLLRRKGVLEEKLSGIPARLHYRIHWRRFFELLDPPQDQGCCIATDKDADDTSPSLPGHNEQGRGTHAGKDAPKPQPNAESTHKTESDKGASIKDVEVQGIDEAEAAWQSVASLLIEAGEAPSWFRPWHMGVEHSGSTLSVRLPVSAKVNGKTFAELTRSELYEGLAQAWRDVSGDPQAVLELEPSSKVAGNPGSPGAEPAVPPSTRTSDASNYGDDQELEVRGGKEATGKAQEKGTRAPGGETTPKCPATATG